MSYALPFGYTRDGSAWLLAVCWKLAVLLVRATGRAMAAFQAGRLETTGDARTENAE